MKHSLPLILSVVFLFSTTAQGQNLVPNGGFEEGVNCPTFIGNLDEECDSWYASILLENDPDPTPDWYHACSDLDVLSTPNTTFGFQSPNNGGGYAGFIAFKTEENSPGYREHIGVELIEPLIIGQTYLCEFWIARFYSGSTGFANDNVGLKFTTYRQFSSNVSAINNEALYSIDTIFTDTTDWHQIQVTFLADSTYGYLHIGNFFDDVNTSVLQDGEFSNLSYYIVDDVTVTNTLNTSSKIGFTDLLLYPNPVVRTSLTVELTSAMDVLPSSITSLSIIDLAGTEVFSMKVKTPSSRIQVPVAHLSSGVYFLRLQTHKNKYYEKFIKTN